MSDLHICYVKQLLLKIINQQLDFALFSQIALKLTQTVSSSAYTIEIQEVSFKNYIKKYLQINLSLDLAASTIKSSEKGWQIQIRPSLTS